MPTPEQIEIRGLARRFAEGELRPGSAGWDAEARLDPEIFRELAELGFLGMGVPEAKGGLGFDVPTRLLLLEELAWGDAAVALSVALHAGSLTAVLAGRGSPAQQEAWLPRLASGDALGTVVPTGAPGGGGSDGVEARRDGGCWVLRGRLPWVVDGARARVVLVPARVEDGSPACFLVEAGRDGWVVEERRRTMGFRAAETVAVRLDGVSADEEARLGAPDEGHRILEEAAAHTRVGLAAVALGIARAAMEHAVAYALEREQFGRPIARFGAIRAKVAEMAARVTAARAVVHLAGTTLEGAASGMADGDVPRSPGARAALARVVASEAAVRVADEAVQVFGGYGYMRDYPVEKLLRDAKGTEVLAGTNEELREIVALDMLGVGGA